MSQNKALRTLETTTESITYAGYAAPGLLKTALSSLASPEMLSVVVIYRDWDLGAWAPCSRCTGDPIFPLRFAPPSVCDFPQHLSTFRNMHSTRKFQLVLCLDIYGCMKDFGMQLLESVVKQEDADGEFEYLDSRPMITCERWATGDSHCCQR